MDETAVSRVVQSHDTSRRKAPSTHFSDLVFARHRGEMCSVGLFPRDLAQGFRFMLEMAAAALCDFLTNLVDEDDKDDPVKAWTLFPDGRAEKGIRVTNKHIDVGFRLADDSPLHVPIDPRAVLWDGSLIEMPLDLADSGALLLVHDQTARGQSARGWIEMARGCVEPRSERVNVLGYLRAETPVEIRRKGRMEGRPSVIRVECRSGVVTVSEPLAEARERLSRALP